jgi:uncharacterized protein
MNEAYVKFPSGELTLEGYINLPDSHGPFPAVVICHPHPLYGGDMFDSVVVAVSASLEQKNIAFLRFNFRGVGASEGKYSGGAGEKKDAAAAIDFVSKMPEIDPEKIGIVGYSFGGGVAFAVAMKNVSVKALALISPVMPDSGWTKLGAYTNPKLYVLGDSDEYFPLVAYERMIKETLKPGEYAIFQNTGHICGEILGAMAERVAAFFAINLI